MKELKKFLKEERGDVGLVFKVIVGVVIGVAVLGLLLNMLNIVTFGTNEFAVTFDPLSGALLSAQGGCISVGPTGVATKEIKGIVKNVRGGYVEGAQVEIAGAGAQDLYVTKGSGTGTPGTSSGPGGFKLNADFNLGGTPFGTTTITFRKDGFVRKDITIVVKKGSCT